jgi:hypothetical protein
MLIRIVTDQNARRINNTLLAISIVMLILSTLRLGIIAVAMAFAAADHQGGLKQVRSEEQRKAKFALQSATSRDQP